MNGETRGAESAESVPCTAWTPQPFPAVQEVFRTWWLKPQALYRCQEKVSGNFQEIPSVSSRPVRVCIKLQNCLVPLSPRLQVAAAGTQACLQVRPCKLALTHSGKLPQSEHGNSRRIAVGRWGGVAQSVRFWLCKRGDPRWIPCSCTISPGRKRSEDS